MKNRYKLPADAQSRYFKHLESISKLSPDELSTLLNVVPRTYRDWRRGKFSIPISAVETIESRYNIPLPFLKTKALQKWRESKISASQKGGYALFRKHGSPATFEGRSKGGKKALAILRQKGVITGEKPFFAPAGYSKQLAEFVGILLGDGHIGKEQWSITLNATADRAYSGYVVKLIQYLFSFTPSVLYRKNSNVVIIYGGGLQAIKYLQKIGLTPGNKVKLQVGVPGWVIESKNFTRECVRGLIETDGGIFKHTYRVNGKIYSYRKLCFSNRSLPLLNFVFNAFCDFGFSPKIIDRVENKKVWLYNQQEVYRYINEFGVHNPRLLVNLK